MPRISYLVLGLLLSVGSSVTARTAAPLPPPRSACRKCSPGRSRSSALPGGARSVRTRMDISPADQIARLHELGRWLQIHGKAIYGTRGGPFLPSAQMESTRAGKTIFLHVLSGPEGTEPVRSIVLPDFSAGPKLLRARVQGAAADLPMNRAHRGEFIIALPESTPGMPTIIVELTYDRSVMEVLPRSL